MNPSILLLLLVLFPLLSAFVTYATGKCLKVHKKAVKSARCILLIATCLIELLAVLWLLVSGCEASCSTDMLRIHLSFDGLRAIYALVTVFMWFGASLLSPQYFKRHGISGRFCFFFLFTLGSTLGIFLSTNLHTTFIFFELTSLASYAWVAEEETLGSLKAGKSYLTIAVIGSMVALAGILLLNHCAGTLSFSELRALCPTAKNRTELYLAAICILLGFGTKAGLFPTPSWLPRVHPVAPTPASALLSEVVTKTGIFGILIVTANVLPGERPWGELLLALGAITMLVGAALALFSVHLKRTLACSSMSQIGFITVGISMICLLGDGNALAANGTVLYMLNHSLSMLVLFLTAGAIYATAHTLHLNELRGYGRQKPLLGAVFLVGGASLAGIPGTLGYLSKALVHESIVEYAAHGGALITLVEWLFLLSGGLTAAHVAKLFVAIFIERPSAEHSPAKKDGSERKKRLTVLSWVALLMGTLPILVLGYAPHMFAERISAFGLSFVGGQPLSHRVEYFSWTNLRGVCISLAIATLVYLLVVRRLLMKRDEGTGLRFYVNRLPSKLALEPLIYLPIGKLLLGLLTTVARIVSALPEKLVIFPLRLIRFAFRSVRALPGRSAKKRHTKDSLRRSRRSKNGK